MPKLVYPYEKRREIQIGYYNLARHALIAAGVPAKTGWSLSHYEEALVELAKVPELDEFQSEAVSAIKALLAYTEKM